MKYEINDDCGGRHSIDAESMQDAKELAGEYTRDGDWGEGKAIVEVWVRELDEDGTEVDAERIEVEVGEDPNPPECTKKEHDWRSPEFLGGCSENPGVWSCGGTTLFIRQVCSHCGCYKTELLHGTQRNPGDYDTVKYEEADECSLEWIASII